MWVVTDPRREVRGILRDAALLGGCDGDEFLGEQVAGERPLAIGLGDGYAREAAPGDEGHRARVELGLGLGLGSGSS